MYEQMRNDVLMELDGKVKTSDILELLNALDRVADKYDIKTRENALVVYEGGVPELVKVYLVCKRMAGLSKETLANYYMMLEMFFNMVNKSPQQITANDIRMWMFRYQKERNISDRTLDQYRSYVCRFFNWAFAEGYIHENPAKNIEVIKYEEKPREAMTQIELEYVRMACETLREKAIVEFLFSTGCRVSELSIVKKSDIDWNDKSVHLFGKGKKHRRSFLNAKAEVALRKYLESRTDDVEYLFVTIRKPIKRISKDGIEKIIRIITQRVANKTGKNITPHIFRHTTATIALHSGMPIADISKLLGHESIDTTMIYAQSLMEEVRNGHRKYIV